MNRSSVNFNSNDYITWLLYNEYVYDVTEVDSFKNNAYCYPYEKTIFLGEYTDVEYELAIIAHETGHIIYNYEYKDHTDPKEILHDEQMAWILGHKNYIEFSGKEFNLKQKLYMIECINTYKVNNNDN